MKTLTYPDEEVLPFFDDGCNRSPVITLSTSIEGVNANHLLVALTGVAHRRQENGKA